MDTLNAQDGLIKLSEFYRGPSRIHGFGVFTRKGFAAGDVITILNGRYVRNINVTEDGDNPLPDAVGLTEDLWIELDAPFSSTNHSCNPNAYIGPRRKLIALRDIDAFDEITIDYSTTECDPNWDMHCLCGAHNCRSHLLPIQRAFATEPKAPPALVRYWKRYHSEN